MKTLVLILSALIVLSVVGAVLHHKYSWGPCERQPDGTYMKKRMMNLQQEFAPCASKQLRNARGNVTYEYALCPAVDGGWTDWGRCLQAEDGRAYKTRTCTNPTPQNGGAQCVGSDKEECVNGGWREWSDCALADDGKMYRRRTCDNPAPQNGGDWCVGDAAELCVANAPKIDGGWSAFSECQAQKDGSWVQTRTCTNPTPQNGGSNCVGESTMLCPKVNGGWSAWSTDCQLQSDGQYYRQRSCDNPAPLYGGDPCVPGTTIVTM